MDVDLALDWLSRARNTDGGWGYGPGLSSRAEPTLHACAAGMADERAISWLAAQTLGWEALLVPACLAGTPGAGVLVEAALSEITERMGLILGEGDEAFSQDGRIPGWSWYPETAAWVEPTSYAVLSLHRAGWADHPRTRQGEDLLWDRQCQDGGWNYGNPDAFGAELESYLPTTAWALLALHDDREGGLARGLARLQDATHQVSPLVVSLALLALSAHRAPTAGLPALLTGLQSPTGDLGGRVDWTALAVAAVGEGEDHVFR